MKKTWPRPCFHLSTLDRFRQFTPSQWPNWLFDEDEGEFIQCFWKVHATFSIFHYHVKVKPSYSSVCLCIQTLSALWFALAWSFGSTGASLLHSFLRGLFVVGANFYNGWLLYLLYMRVWICVLAWRELLDFFSKHSS